MTNDEEREGFTLDLTNDAGLLHDLQKLSKLKGWRIVRQYKLGNSIDSFSGIGNGSKGPGTVNSVRPLLEDKRDMQGQYNSRLL